MIRPAVEVPRAPAGGRTPERDRAAHREPCRASPANPRTGRPPPRTAARPRRTTTHGTRAHHPLIGPGSRLLPRSDGRSHAVPVSRVQARSTACARGAGAASLRAAGRGWCRASRPTTPPAPARGPPGGPNCPCTTRSLDDNPYRSGSTARPEVAPIPGAGVTEHERASLSLLNTPQPSRQSVRCRRGRAASTARCRRGRQRDDSNVPSSAA